MRTLLPLTALLFACTGGGAADTAELEPEDTAISDVGPLSPGDGCDALVPTYCAFPFPSDFWTVADPSTPTGRRVAFTQDAMPASTVDPTVFNRADGFSPSPPLLAHLPGATTAGLATPVTIERSLEADSPTVLLDLETGERVPHWAELDVNTPDPDLQAFMMRPVVGLVPGRRYGVAIRGVVDDSGAALAPSEAFVALRDGTFIDDASVDDRRGDYASLFSALEAAGVARADLQLAWAFTVASTEDTTTDMLAVRDQADAWSADAENLAYDLTVVEASPADYPGFALHVEGTVTVPLFRETASPGALLLRDDDGHVTWQTTVDVPFWLLIPESAADAPASIVQYGHGMLGSGAEVLWNDDIHAFATTANAALLGMDFTGFAVDDTVVVIGALSSGAMHNFQGVPDGLHQAMADFLVGLRTVAGPINADERLQLGGHAPLDPTRLHYYGGSQGGIYGGVYMAITPDIQRGILAVPGQAYSLMLERSVNFDEYSALLRPRFPGGLDVPLVIGLIQMLWDRAEPSGYTRYLHDPLPGSQARDVLMLVAVGDHQVTTQSAHLMARTIGEVPHLGQPVRPLFGIPTVEGPHTGSGLIEYDFGETPEPVENRPATEGRDPHGRIGEVAAAFLTGVEFLETGTTQNYCDGPCDPD